MQTPSPQLAPAAHGRPIGRQRRCRSGLTLVELLVTISIISILASIFLGALWSAADTAKVMKTRSMIVKLNNLIMPRYEAYRTRRVPINISVTGATTTDTNMTYATTMSSAATSRLNALHELMRFEMPEEWTDVTDTPVIVPRPALSQAYLSAYNTVFAHATSAQQALFGTYENAETLYMIVTLGFVDELGGRDLFNEGSIGDTDGDGFPEFLDAWGTPIRFLRWAPGFTASELNGAGGTLASASGTTLTVTDTVGTSSAPYSYGMSRVNNAYAGKLVTFFSVSSGKTQSATIISSSYLGGVTTLNLSSTPSPEPATGDYFGIDLDPFNPLNLDPSQLPSSSTATTHVSFAIYPLIYSAGPDRVYSIVSEDGHTSVGSGATVALPGSTVNPFWSVSNSAYNYGPVGWTADVSGESSTSGWSSNMNGWLDNIHNHMIGSR